MQKIVWLLLLALLISACGGDSGEPPANTAPTLTRNFADITAAVDDTRPLDLVTYFDDRQQDASTLEYDVLSSDPAVVAASLASGSILELNFTGVGSATVTVTATDSGGLSASDSFDVTVTSDGGGNGTNTPPTSLDLPNQTLQTSAPNASLDLADFFDDAEDGAQGLVYSAQSSDPNVVVVSTSGSTLTLQAQGAGTATVTVTARDSSGATVSESFTVTVEDDGGNGGGNGDNSRPSLVTPLEDTNIGADEPTTIDLSDFFDDAEDGAEGLIYSANSSDDGVVVATVNGTILTLDPRELGTAEITITATDSEGLTIEDTFMVTVGNQPSEAPIQVRDLSTVTALVGDTDRLIRLTRYFDDAQDGSGGLTYTAESDNTNVVVATIDADGVNLRLDFGIPGTAVVTVTATDSDGNSISDTFTVLVDAINAGNTPPRAQNINAETEEDTPIDVTFVATDADGDNVSYTVASQPSNGTLSGTAPNLTYTPDAGFTGTDTFTYSASDGEDSSNTATVTITVNEVAVGNPRFEFVAGGSADQVLVRLVDYTGEWIGFSFDVGSGGNVTLQNPPFGSEGTGVGNFLAVSNGTNDRSPITVGGATTTPITGGGNFVILNLEGSGTDTLTISNGTLLVDDQGNEISVAGDSIEVTLAGGGGGGGGGGNPTFTMTAGPGANQVTVALENYTGNWFSYNFSTSGTVSVDTVQGTGIASSLLTSTGPNGTVGVGVSPISGSGDIAILTVSGTGTLTISGGEILTDLSVADGAPVSVSGSSFTLP